MRTVTKWLLVFVMTLLPAAVVSAAEMKLFFPQGRAAFQTNELIDVSVIRSGEGELPAGNVTLALAEAGGKSTMTFVFGLKAGSGSATDNLRLNGWMIKPGAYTLTATMGDATATADIEIFSHVRRSTYKTIQWNGPRGDNMKGHGEGGLELNLMFGGVEEISIREKMDIMGIMAMGGAHQHDMNLECDWSDPNVYIGAVQRAMDRGLPFRTMPNAVGVHLHDEPGLTWNKHPHLKDANGNPLSTHHDIASQRRAYASAFGKEQTWVHEIDTANPDSLADWTHINDFKMRYMESFWRASRDAIERIKPGMLAVTQSIYGWPFLFDGYYFNVARSMPVVSGHGGYNDSGLMNLQASYYLECSLPRQWDKPTWYLPEWGNLTSEQYLLEHYLSFVTGIQGLEVPPQMNVKARGAAGVTQANRTVLRLGTIFTRPATTRQDVAVLYSKSDSYFRKSAVQQGHLSTVYLACKIIQQPTTVVVEEDVLDGTLAASHKAVIVAGVEYLDPAVIDALADFAKTGGLVLVTDEVKVKIPGAVALGCSTKSLNAEVWQAYLAAAKDITDNKAKLAKRIELSGWAVWLKEADPLAKSLKAKLAAAKIAPAFVSDNPLIAPGRQVRGEIEYLFAVNFAMAGHLEDSFADQPGPTTATITLTDDGRPVYDAMTAKDLTATFAKSNGGVSAKLDFAAGDMKALARTARPIGGVLVAAPVVHFDSTREDQPPIQMDLAATLVDKNNRTLSGTAPLQIVVKDPAGNVRYDLFRATDAGTCSLTLPLAANDTAGKWTVTVTDLLAGTTGEASFDFKPLTRARNLAGATHRAVYFGDDKANIYRFFRDQRNVVIAVGESDYNRTAAERLVKILKPYNITATIVNAKDVPARELTEEEARTWCGTTAAGSKSNLKPGRENNPATVGWDLPHPAIVLGTPEDNVMIRHMTNNQGRCVLPYRPSATFPGRGNGLVAWNIQALGHDVHALICVAYDAEGMSQAVGTLFELGVGLDPLLPMAMPTSATIEVK